MRREVVWVAMLLILLFPAVSSAAVFRDGQNSFTLEAPLSDDLYVTGERVDIGQAISDDLFAAGELVEVTSRVGADVYAAGGKVRVSGDVDDDLHAAGQDVEISGTTSGDVFAAGQNVKVAAEAQVGKDLYVAGEDVTIAGTVGGSVRAAGRVNVAASAKIAGDLRVYSNENPTIAEGAQIGGAVSVKAIDTDKKDTNRFLLASWVRSVVALFLLSCVLVYGARAFSRRVIGGLGEATGVSLLTGILWLLLFIPASLILLITFVGLPLAGGLLLLTFLACLAATGIATAGVGRWILGKMSKESGSELTWVHALVGAVVYKGVQLLPVVGHVATFVVVLFFFGATLLTFFKLIRNYDSEPNTSSQQDSGTGVGTA